MGTGMAPASRVPKNAGKKAASVRSMIVTVSRRPMPRLRSAVATFTARRHSQA